MTTKTTHPKWVTTKDHDISIHTMGKRLRITAIFTDVDEANAHMEHEDSAAVVACAGPFIFIANRYDNGEKDSAIAKARGEESKP